MYVGVGHYVPVTVLNTMGKCAENGLQGGPAMAPFRLGAPIRARGGKRMEDI